MSVESRIEPVRSEVEVPLPQQKAFEFFTAHLSRWWPLETHSVSGERAETAVFELTAGGEIFELAENSEKIVWGTVMEFDPPSRVVFSWHPARPPETAQEIEVLFTESAGGTRVLLTHRGWEEYGEKADDARNSYVSGWQYVLGECYRDAIDHRD